MPKLGNFGFEGGQSGGGGGSTTWTFPPITQTLSDGNNTITLPSSCRVITVNVENPIDGYIQQVPVKQTTIPSSSCIINVSGSITNAIIYVSFTTT